MPPRSAEHASGAPVHVVLSRWRARRNGADALGGEAEVFEDAERLEADLLVQLERAGIDDPELLVDGLLDSRFEVVKHTPLVRTSDYADRFADAAGRPSAGIAGDVHHWIPLYLGGSNQAGALRSGGNLVELPSDVHREVHRILEGQLHPTRLHGRYQAELAPTAAVVRQDGSLDYVPFSQLPGGSP